MDELLQKYWPQIIAAATVIIWAVRVEANGISDSFPDASLGAIIPGHVAVSADPVAGGQAAIVSNKDVINAAFPSTNSQTFMLAFTYMAA